MKSTNGLIASRAREFLIYMLISRKVDNGSESSPKM